MTGALLAVVAFLVPACGIALLAVQGRAKRAEAERNRAVDALNRVNERVERLNRAVEENRKTQEAANAQRKELAETPDAGLADRAGALFGR